jgi:uncharacterized protein YecT (DUF1311 family)
MMRSSWVLVALAALALAALATGSPARADDCATAGTQYAMDQCAEQSFKETDAELNALYRQITVRLTANQQTTQSLVSAQKAWLLFRDAECKFVASASEGGSVHPMIVTGCLDHETAKRVDELKIFLKCTEGDLACPVPAR